MRLKLHRRNININKFLFYIVFICSYKWIYDYMVLNYLDFYYINNITYRVDFNKEKIAVAWIIFIFVSIFNFFINNKKQYSDIFIFVLFLLYYIPVNSSFYLNNTEYKYFILQNIYWIILCGCVHFFNRNNTSDHLITIDIERFNIKLYMLATIFFIIIIAGVYNYNKLEINLDLNMVYNVRETYSKANVTIWLSSIKNFGSIILIPIFMTYSFLNKKWILLVFSVFVQLALFSITMEKTILFSIFVVFGTIIFKKLVQKNPTLFILFGVFFLNFSAFLEGIFLKTTKIFVLFSRRMMYLPALLNYEYYDFFSRHKKLFWTQDIAFLHKIFRHQYEQSVIDIINYNYFGGFVPSPNSGMFSEAYMHFGIFGIIIYGVLFALFIYILQRNLLYYPLEVQVVLAFLIGFLVLSLPITSGVFLISTTPIIIITIYLKIKIKKSN